MASVGLAEPGKVSINSNKNLYLDYITSLTEEVVDPLAPTVAYEKKFEGEFAKLKDEYDRQLNAHSN